MLRIVDRRDRRSGLSHGRGRLLGLDYRLGAIGLDVRSGARPDLRGRERAPPSAVEREAHRIGDRRDWRRHDLHPLLAGARGLHDADDAAVAGHDGRAAPPAQVVEGVNLDLEAVVFRFDQASRDGILLARHRPGNAEQQHLHAFAGLGGAQHAHPVGRRVERKDDEVGEQASVGLGVADAEPCEQASRFGDARLRVAALEAELDGSAELRALEGVSGADGDRTCVAGEEEHRSLREPEVVAVAGARDGRKLRAGRPKGDGASERGGRHEGETPRHSHRATVTRSADRALDPRGRAP